MWMFMNVPMAQVKNFKEHFFRLAGEKSVLLQAKINL